MIAFIIGNGVSRKPIDLHQLKGKGTIFGCNALYRDFNDYDYLKSQEFFKRIDDSKKNNSTYSSKYIRSLMNLGRHVEAERYSRNLENKKIPNFESKLILGLHELKNGNSHEAKIYFNQLNQSIEHQMVFNILKTSLKSWASMEESKKEMGISLC